MSLPEGGAQWCYWKDSSWFQSISSFAWTPRCQIKCNKPFVDLLSKILQMFIMPVYMCCLGDDLKKSCLRSRARSSFLWSYINSIMWTSSREGELMFPLICSRYNRVVVYRKELNYKTGYFLPNAVTFLAVSRAGKDVIGLSLLSRKINVHYFLYKVRLTDLFL